MVVVLSSAHHVASWLEEPETFKAKMGTVHDGRVVLVAALEASFGREPLALAAWGCAGPHKRGTEHGSVPRFSDSHDQAVTLVLESGDTIPFPSNRR